ncbi:MAG: hypothetical protein M3Q76_03030 [Acidobacteriota bacterium]|nr:hypothetical protein [Acidobacteriota bacterium]
MSTSLPTPTTTSPMPSTTRPTLPTHDTSARPPAAIPQPSMPPPVTTLSAPLCELLARLKPLPSSAMLERIFTDLSRVLDFLRLAEDGCRQERLTLATLSVLKNVRKQGQAVVELIASSSTGDAAAESEQLSRAALDSISQQITIELESVFDVELAGMEQRVQSAQERVKMESAHGQLRACFQQSIVTLAQVFEPSLEAESLFDDFATQPQQQSLTLADDLWNLIKYARRAAVERDPFAIAVLTEHLRRFCDSSKCHLRYQDWEACTAFIEQLTKPQRVGEAIPLVEGLCCQLEILLAQIKRSNTFAAASPALPATQT